MVVVVRADTTNRMLLQPTNG